MMIPIWQMVMLSIAVPLAFIVGAAIGFDLGKRLKK